MTKAVKWGIIFIAEVPGKDWSCLADFFIPCLFLFICLSSRTAQKLHHLGTASHIRAVPHGISDASFCSLWCSLCHHSMLGKKHLSTESNPGGLDALGMVEMISGAFVADWLEAFSFSEGKGTECLRKEFCCQILSFQQVLSHCVTHDFREVHIIVRIMLPHVQRCVAVHQRLVKQQRGGKMWIYKQQIRLSISSEIFLLEMFFHINKQCLAVPDF